MKMTVIVCPCQNPMPHRKFETEDGRQGDGFFSLTEARYILNALKEKGQMNDTEVAATDAELVASDLPEYANLADLELQDFAAGIVARIPPEGRDEYIATGIKVGALSPANAERLRELMDA